MVSRSIRSSGYVFSEPDDFISRSSDNRTVIDAVCKLLQRLGDAAHGLGAERGRRTCARPPVDESPARAASPQSRTHAPQCVHREALQKRLDAIGRNNGQPIRLFPSRRNLRQKLVRRNSSGSGQPCRDADSLLEPLRDRGRQRLVPTVLGDVEICFIKRQGAPQAASLLCRG